MLGKLLGIGLLVGGFMASMVIGYVITIYVADGTLTTGMASMALVLVGVVVVLPQVALGVYLFRQSWQIEGEEG